MSLLRCRKFHRADVRAISFSPNQCKPTSVLSFQDLDLSATLAQQRTPEIVGICRRSFSSGKISRRKHSTAVSALVERKSPSRREAFRENDGNGMNSLGPSLENASPSDEIDSCDATHGNYSFSLVALRLSTLPRKIDRYRQIRTHAKRVINST